MLTFYHQISGGAVAREIYDDEEETAQFLESWAELCDPESLPKDLKEYVFSRDSRRCISRLLRAIADEFDKED